MHKVIQNKLTKKTRRGLSLMLPLGLRRSLPSPRGSRAHPRAAALRRPFGEAFSATRLILPVSFLIILSFLYINIYVETALRSSSAISDSQSHQVVVSDATNLTISFLDDSGTATTSPTNIDVTPSAAGVFNSGDVTIDVSTNYDYGYTLTMSASTSSLSRSEAVGDRTYEIPTLLASKDDNNNPYTCTPATSTSCNFPKNYWGLKRTSAAIIDAGYIPMIPNYNMPVTATDAGADSSTSTVTVGVKLSNETPYGLYTIDMNFLAVANLAPSTAYMQDATPSSLAYLMPNVGDSTVLYDKRDNQEYTVAKLADGKYWMTKNLNLAGGTVLTSEDTDMAPGYQLPTTYVDPETGATLPTGFGEGNVLPASSKNGFDNDYKAFIYNTGNNTDTCTDPGCYSYYSYNAATLGSGMDISSDNTDAPYSVCPKGWKLPTSRLTLELAKTSSDFYQMAIHYGLNPADVNETSDAAPTFCTSAGDCPGAPSIPRFLRAGNYNGSTLYLGGTDGYYWSSTVNSSAGARHLYFNSGGVYSTVNNPRRYGFSIRCLFDDTMQSFSSDYASALAMEESVTLRDARDNQEYTVTKLKDGKVWMTKNLNLAGGTTLTPADSDVAENYTLPASQKITSGTTLDGGFNDDAGAYVFNSSNKTDSCGSGCYSYYSWNAATAMSGAGINYDNTDAPYSICPAGWRLPTSRTTVALAQGTPGSDFYKMAIHYGLKDSAVNEGPDNDGMNFCILGSDCGTNTVPRFLRAGTYYGSTFSYGGTYGNYWSSTASSSTHAHYLSFSSDSVHSADKFNRRDGFPVRCLLK